MNINYLAIEVTRRCNMSCDHCLRGDAQNLDLDTNYIRKLFDHINNISCITFTGGEPSLVPHIISKIIDIAKEKNVDIERFYIATNAKQVTDRFIEAILKCHLYCNDTDEYYGIEISNDIQHNFEDIDENNIKKLLAFRFARKRHKDDHFDYGQRGLILLEGRAEIIYDGTPLSINSVPIEDNSIEEFLYLNCLGDILPHIDLSYEHQENQDLIICNVNDVNLNLKRSIEAYNERFKKLK